MTYPVNRACSPPCGKFRQRRQQQGELPFEKGSSCLVSRLNWPTREPEATALRGFSGSAHAIWLHGLVPPHSFRLLFASIRDGGIWSQARDLPSIGGRESAGDIWAFPSRPLSLLTAPRG